MSRPHASTARLFVALDPPEDVREQLSAWARLAVRALGLRSGSGSPVRLLDIDLLHLTLCFLGEQPIGEIETIAAVLAQCAGAVGELQVGAPLWLPPRRPRALAVEVRDRENVPAPERLEPLHDRLLHALAPVCQGELEHRRRFRAHVTLARLRGDRQRMHGLERELPATPALSFTPSSLVLYRSRLSPAGAAYEELAQATLTSS